jgi:mannobiose 2-epimerase
MNAKPMKPRWCICALLTSLCAGTLTAAPKATPDRPAIHDAEAVYVAPTKENYLKLADEVETALHRDVLNVWFPRTLDTKNGGFQSEFTRDWKPLTSQGKFSVFQARMTWIAAEVVMRRPELKDQFLPVLQHGMKYLNDVLWDKQYGGFYWGLDDNGQVSPRFSDGKHLYGMSFALYAAAAAYQATKDPKALDLAARAFRWMDEHAHDTTNGGYFEWLSREGKVIAPHAESGKVDLSPPAPFPIGYKSMNTHLHLLESFTQLFEVWPDPTLRQRLEEMLAILRDKISVEPGAMNLYFTNAWGAIPGHDSYGHDVEAAYLMLETSAALGHTHDVTTERMAKMLVDHALAYGWDDNLGGFYQDGTAYGAPEDKRKEWWVQVEGLNALLLMHEKYGAKSDLYFKAFQQQWNFIKEYQTDSEFHGLYFLIGTDGKPTTLDKGSIWKAAYHDGRAFLNVSERLRKLAQPGSQ